MIRKIFIIGILAIVALVLAQPVIAYTSVTGPTVISSSGHYILENDIINGTINNTIEIRSSGVLFDGMNHTIDGVDGNASYTNDIWVGSFPQFLDNITLQNVTLRNRSHGIFFRNVTNSSAINCSIDQNGQDGIRVEGGNHLTFSNNTITNSTYRGISLTNSVFIQVSNTSIRYEKGVGGTGGFGLRLDNSNQNTFTHNIFSENNVGIFLTFSYNNLIQDNILVDNTFTGIELEDSGNNRILGNDAFDNQRHGVYLGSSDGNTISENNFSNNHDQGIFLNSSVNNTVTGNYAVNNAFNGIFIRLSLNNTISANTIRGNLIRGIALNASLNNTLSNNTIVFNPLGLGMSAGTSNNTIYNNYFNNTVNLGTTTGVNIWNITKTPGLNILGGPSLGGNYWSDYAGIDTDDDGIGDTDLPYTASGNITPGGDWLPLRTGGSDLVADFTANVTSGPASLTVQFNDTSTGSPTTWNWTFGDIGAGNTSTLRNPVHTYTAKGNYTVNLTVSNAYGSNSIVAIGLVRVGLRPNASFAWSPAEPEVNQTVTFDASASVDPDGTITAYHWTFDDGTPLLNQTPPFANHIFREPRVYNVILTVIDNETFTGTTIGHVSVFAKIVTITTAVNGITSETVAGVQSLVVNATTIGSTGGHVTTTDTSVILDYVSEFWQNVEVRAGAVNGTVPGNITVQNVTEVVMQSAPITSALNETIGNVSVALDIALKQYVQDAAIEVKIMQGADATAMHGFQLAANMLKNDILDVAYTVELSNTGLINTNLTTNETRASQKAIITMSVSHTWVSRFDNGTNNQGRDAVSIIRINESGNSSILDTRFVRYDPVTNLDWFDADSPYGLSIFGMIVMHAQQSNPPPATPPVASFTANVTSGTAPLTVQFNDTSTGSPTLWNWSFGDGTFATVQNPVYTYTNPGNFTVALNSTSPSGTDTMIKSGFISVSSGVNTTLPTPPENPVKLIFIHHSTGQNWLADDNGRLGIALRDNNYYVSDTNYDWGPDSIGSNTDIGNWWTWFRSPSSPEILADLFNESGQHSTYSRLSTDPGGQNKIVMLKSCFPNSNLMGNPTDTVPPIEDNLLKANASGSEHHTVANAKGIYIDLLEYFRTKPDTLFVVIAAPPLSAPDNSANARVFNQWLVNDWLAGYNQTNVFVWDFYNVLTTNGGNANITDLNETTGNHHRWWNNGMQHPVNLSFNTSAYPLSESDDHPTQAGNLKATGEYVPLLNYAYNRCAGNNANPVANFIANVTSGTAPLPVQFTDTSICLNPSKWNWSFGDGTYSVLPNPIHTFTNGGTFTSRLTITNSSGFNTTVSGLSILIYPKGDFNTNGRVDIGDVTRVAYMAVGLIPQDPRADFHNGNGTVLVGDAAKIAWYYVGKVAIL